MRPKVYEVKGKFAGLDYETALKRAEQCLPFDDLQVVSLCLEGMSNSRIAKKLNIHPMGVATVSRIIERSKEDIARYHIAQWEPQPQEYIAPNSSREQ